CRCPPWKRPSSRRPCTLSLSLSVSAPSRCRPGSRRPRRTARGALVRPPVCAARICGHSAI
ncbi:MAG: hypothetical protein AVDCRST_MAG40-1371, partial [uncultured Gemmatimonadaceae bacterium]